MTVIQRLDKLEVCSTFEGYADTNAIRVSHIIKNISDAEKQTLIKEAVDVYNRMTPDKLQSVPYLPKGYTRADDPLVAVGLKTDKKVYLGVWTLKGKHHVTLDLPEMEVKNVAVAYPQGLETKFTFDRSSLTIDFTKEEQARLFEITI